jgi:predicted PurR-regulated permease PerM
LICLVLILILVVALGFGLAQIGHTLVQFGLAAVLALVLLPLVDFGERHYMPRWLAVVTTYVGFILAVAVASTVMLTPIVRQGVEFANALPSYVANLQAQLTQVEENLAGTPVAAALAVTKTHLVSNFAAWSTQLIEGLVGLIGGLGGALTDAVLILIISIYMLLSGRRIHTVVHRFLPDPYNRRFLFTSSALVLVMGGFIRSQIVLSLLLGAMVTVGLTLLGMPYSLLLGLFAMVLGIIPMFGSALSAVPALLVALTQPWPMVLWVLIFFIIVQNVQDQVLAPRIQGENVGLHPLAVLFALLAGAQLWGALGAIFGVPILGFIWIMVVAVYRSFAYQSPVPTSAEGLITTDERQATSAEQGVVISGEEPISR